MNRTKSKLLFRLRQWRDERARRANLPTYRILPNKVLEVLAESLPATREEILLIPGIKEAKWQQYGAELLAMIGDALESGDVATSHDEDLEIALPLAEHNFESELGRGDNFTDTSSDEEGSQSLQDPFSVGAFLDTLNESFSGVRVSVRGEVSGIEERRGHVYFSLKDALDGSVMSCVLFRQVAFMFAGELEEGGEVIVEGTPNIWKPRGKFSFQVASIRRFGEGALRRAYEALCRKFEAEGIFDESRKRALPTFPKRIALVSSREGAALGDFMANIGRRGFHIALVDARVEGAQALPDLIRAIRFFNASPDEWGVLVVTRGGGSLESLEAFNAEVLVREIATSEIPVLAAIGHEKDVPLSARAADMMVSTPTAAAKAISRGFEDAEGKLSHAWDRSYRRFSLWKDGCNYTWDRTHALARRTFDGFISRRHALERIVGQLSAQVSFSIKSIDDRKNRRMAEVLSRMFSWIQLEAQLLSTCESRIEAMNPIRLLAQGYSLLSKNGRIVRSVSQIAPGDTVHLRLADGEGEAIVRECGKS